MGRLTLLGAGLTMLVVGALHLFAPQMMVESAQIVLSTPSHLHVIRSVYGGAYIGIAALFLLGAWRPAYQRSSLVALAILFTGFACGRLFSIAMDGLPVQLYLRVLAVEIVFAVLAVVSLRRSA